MSESIQDLEQQFKRIVEMDFNDTKSSTLSIHSNRFIKKYGLYGILGLYVFIMVAILRSKWFSKYDVIKKKYIFLWKRYFIICILLLLILYTILFLWNKFMFNKFALVNIS